MDRHEVAYGRRRLGQYDAPRPICDKGPGWPITLGVIAATAFAVAMLASCATTPPSAVPDEIEVDADWLLNFVEIGWEYVIDEHDCDDMAQEWAHYLESRGIARERITLVVGRSWNTGLYHAWIEVDRFYVFDPTHGIFGAQRPLVYVGRYMEIDRPPMPWWDGSGLRTLGDRWESAIWDEEKDEIIPGHWVRSDV